MRFTRAGVAIGGCLLVAMATLGLAPNQAWALPAFWLLVIIVAGALVRLAYLACKRLLGDDQMRLGGRDAAIAAAVLAACVASPRAAIDAGDFVGSGVRALFVETTVLMSEPVIGPSAAIQQVIYCWADEDRCTLFAKAKAEAESRAQAQAQILATKAPETQSQVDVDRKSVLEEPQAESLNFDSRAGAWIWFLSILLGALLIGRAVRQAYERQKASETDASEADGGFVISYRAWMALAIYVAILAPAGYFSIGSLLYLDLDTPSSSLAAVSEALDDAERRALDAFPGVELNTDALSAQAKVRVTDSAKQESLLKAIEASRASAAAIGEGRRQYKQLALEYANELKSTATAGQFDDYRLLLLANYERVINETRLKARPCLERLAQFQEALNQAPAAAPPPPAATEPAPGEPASAEAVAAPTAPNPQPWAQESANAVTACQAAVKFPAVPTPASFQTEAGAFPGTLYEWLAKSPQATVLIVGLIGFGLFGAAIRMMARDKTVVEAQGKVGDATGEIFVQGLGAAFTVFLAGQAGMDLLAVGGRPNAFGLLFLCFVGAVFADDIWRRAKEAISKTGGGQGGGAGASTPPAGQGRTGGQQPSAPKTPAGQSGAPNPPPLPANPPPKP